MERRTNGRLNRDGLTGWLHSYATINFLHFAILLFVICTVILIAVSLVTAPPAPEKVAGITFATADRSIEEGSRGPGWRRTDLILSVLLALSVGAIWLYFS